MSQPDPQSPKPHKPVLHHKTTQSFVFLGAIGWTAFILTTTLWLKSDKKRKAAISEVDEQKQELDALYKSGQTDLQAALAETQLHKEEVTAVHQHCEKQRLELTAQLQKQQASSTNRYSKLYKNFTSAFDRIDATKISLNEANYWESVLKEQSIFEKPDKQKFHSILANKFFELSEIEKTKLHLELSNNYDQEQKQRLLGQLDIEAAMKAAKTSITDKQGSIVIQQKLKVAHSLVAQLKKDPAERIRALSLTQQLIQLETSAALTAPPKQAVKAINNLLEKHRKLASSEKNDLSLKLGYLETAKNAVLVTQSLGLADEQKKLMSESSKVLQDVLMLDSSNQVALRIKAAIQLMEVDSLFLDGSAAAISKSLKSLDATSRKLKGNSKIVFGAASTGHKAATLYEKGQTSSALSSLNTAISRLKKVSDSEPNSAIASFRLGILYWERAQLTTSSDQSLDSLKTSSTTLLSALKKDAGLYEHSIRQFLAMVSGDMGHQYSDKGLKKEAKTHFQTALTQWQKLESNWGSTAESKEGIRYCKWRIKNL